MHFVRWWYSAQRLCAHLLTYNVLTNCPVFHRLHDPLCVKVSFISYLTLSGFSHWMKRSNAFIWKHFRVRVCAAAELWNQQRVRWSSLCVRGRTCLLACRQALLALSTPRQHTASTITLSCSVDVMTDFMLSLIHFIAFLIYCSFCFSTVSVEYLSFVPPVHF